MIVYFISALLLSSSALGEDELCKICTCGSALYLNKSMYITNCTYANVTERNIFILQKLPEETEVFIFNGNNVPNLPINIFGNHTNLTNLKVIDMTDNKIEDIKGKTFHHVPLVERLILDHNSISLNSHPRVFSNFESLRELHLTDAFLDYESADLAKELHNIFYESNLKKLQKLHLEQNEIDSFTDKNVFCDLENLMDLHLGYNRLKNLSYNITCLPHLRFIDMEANLIERFTRNELAVFDSLTVGNRTLTIDIHKNPFVCDCVVNKLHFWLKKTKVIVKNNDTIQCHSLNVLGRTMYLRNYTYNISDCVFKPYSDASDDEIHVFVHYLYLAVSFILVLLLIYLSVKYSFVYCRQSVVPTGKVHYVVIRNPDDNREVHV